MKPSNKLWQQNPRKRGPLKTPMINGPQTLPNSPGCMQNRSATNRPLKESWNEMGIGHELTFETPSLQNAKLGCKTQQTLKPRFKRILTNHRIQTQVPPLSKRLELCGAFQGTFGLPEHASKTTTFPSRSCLRTVSLERSKIPQKCGTPMLTKIIPSLDGYPM